MTKQTLLLQFHNLGKRIAMDAMENGDEAEDEQEEAANAECDDFRRMCSQRLRKGKESWQDPAHRSQMLIALWATEPVDYLNQTLQFRESSTEVLLQMVAEDGLLARAERELARRVVP